MDIKQAVADLKELGVESPSMADVREYIATKTMADLSREIDTGNGSLEHKALAAKALDHIVVSFLANESMGKVIQSQERNTKTQVDAIRKLKEDDER